MNVITRLFQKSKPQNQTSLINLELINTFQNFSGTAYENATFRSAVDCISRHCGKLTAHCNSPKLDALLQTAPNDYITAYDLFYKTATAYFTGNNAFILIQRANGNIQSLYNLNPSSVEFIGAADGSLYIKMLFSDGKEVLLPYTDIIHLRRHFSTNELLGSDNLPLYSLLETADTLGQGIQMATKNAVNIRGILKFNSLLNPTQVKLEKEQFVKDYLDSTNNGGIAATDQRFEFHPTNTTPYSVPTDTIKAVNTDIYNYLGINDKIISGNFTEDEFQSFYESVVEPFALQLSLEFSRKCNAHITFSAERLEFSSAKTRISLLRELLPYGIISINEARKLLSLPEVEDGDKRLQSLNFADSAIVNKYQLESEENGNGNGKA